MPDEFSHLADAYEAMIDWPKRLANESPLFRWLIDRVEARRVLDAACGTGHHAHLLHTWGLVVEGADLSPAMIQRCRQSWGESDRLRWVTRGYDQPADCPRHFDLAICIGNSLGLAPDHETVDRAVANLLAAIRAGGAVMIHVPNLWKLPDGPCIWQKCLRTNLPGAGDSLIIKGVHRCGDVGFVDVHVTNLDITPPGRRSESVRFLGLRPDRLESSARAAGALAVESFGNYQRTPYDPASSDDLIFIAFK